MPSPSIFTFDADAHEYRISGVRVPSVTQIIAAAVGTGFEFLANAEWYLQRGRAIHACAPFVAAGKPFECDPRIAGHVAALKKWFFDFAPTDMIVETPVYSVDYRYAGTPDLLCKIDGKRFVVDWKSSLDLERVAWQMAAYALATGRANSTGIRGMGVQLLETGDYMVTKPLDLRRPQQEFLAMRSVFSIRERLGVT
jgi:hypothetical protein